MSVPAQPLSGVYAKIARELERTWQLEYVTAGRPGDSLQVRVAVPGSGSASAVVRLPGHEVRSRGRSAWASASFYVAIVAAATVLVLLLPAFLAVARRIGARGADPYYGQVSASTRLESDQGKPCACYEITFETTSRRTVVPRTMR